MAFLNVAGCLLLIAIGMQADVFDDFGEIRLLVAAQQAVELS